MRFTSLTTGSLAAVLAAVSLGCVSRSDDTSQPAAAQASASPALSVGGDVCSGTQSTGTGLRGAYYAGAPGAAKPVLIRVDSQVDSLTAKTWGSAPKEPRPASVRWCGWLRPATSGPHRLYTGSAAAKMFVSKKQLDDASGPIDMVAGQPYALLIEVVDLSLLENDLRLEWTPPESVRYPIPQSVLYAPLETVDPGCDQ